MTLLLRDTLRMRKVHYLPQSSVNLYSINLRDTARFPNQHHG